jgi:polysaccharide pyruvyl transferase WcaK-like protein
MDYPALIRDLITHFQGLSGGNGGGCEVHLVPHVIVRSGPMTGEDDYGACAVLAQEFSGTVLAPAFASPSEAKSYIAGFNFFMGARMHACIAAFSSGVPVVPMAYSRKFEGLFGTICYTRTVDCTTQSADEIRTAIVQGYEDRATLKAEAETAMILGREKLAMYETRLREVLQAL